MGHKKDCNCCDCKDKHHRHHGHHHHEHHEHHRDCDCHECRGKRGHRGHHGPTGSTGPTGPCCTGPTGPAGSATVNSLFAKVTQGTCAPATFDAPQGTLVCKCFTTTKPSSVLNIFVSLSADVSPDQGRPLGEVDYRVVIDDQVIPNSEAASSANGYAGNSIVLQWPVLPGPHRICVQWKHGPDVNGIATRACILEDEFTHASLLITSSDGIAEVDCP